MRLPPCQRARPITRASRSGTVAHDAVHPEGEERPHLGLLVRRPDVDRDAEPVEVRQGEGVHHRHAVVGSQRQVGDVPALRAAGGQAAGVGGEDVAGGGAGGHEVAGYLRPGVTLAPGETLAPGLGPAEADVVNFAQQNGLRLLEVGATRPICPNCATLIERAGAQPVTPLKAR